MIEQLAPVAAGAALAGAGWLVDRALRRRSGVEAQLGALTERVARVEGSLGALHHEIGRIAEAVLGVRP